MTQMIDQSRWRKTEELRVEDLNKYESVIITWQDTFSQDGEFFSVEETLEDIESGIQETIGFFVQNIQDKIMLCRELSPDSQSSEYFRDLYVIPHAMILKIQKLS